MTMILIVVPFLCIITGLIMAVVLYWNTKARIALLYKPITDVKEATHVVIKGKPGNIDICKLYDYSD